ncbi:cellulase family glycosylhydrolase [Micromonospora inyonensis]|uniref:cellulase family glycosylhydrolase n=1 Tax=Micromonospora inyonensis TaxID=47866 RepID=UPI000ADAA3EC
MKKPLVLFGAALLTLVSSVLLFVSPAHAAVGLHVENGTIVEANGQPFVMRGVNHPHVWYTGRTDSFADVKALGANTVRVVLGSGRRWGPSNDVAQVISLCKENRLICVLEVHDTTGYGEEGAAASLDEAVDYWISQKPRRPRLRPPPRPRPARRPRCRRRTGALPRTRSSGSGRAASRVR